MPRGRESALRAELSGIAGDTFVVQAVVGSSPIAHPIEVPAWRQVSP
jgi:hypothetical protein